MKKFNFRKGFNTKSNIESSQTNKIDFSFKKEKQMPTYEAKVGELQIEADARGELEELYASYDDAAKREKEIMKQQNDTGFWFACYFNNPAQLIEFFDKVGSHLNGQYVDGMKLAKAIGIELQTPNVDAPKPFRMPANLPV